MNKTLQFSIPEMETSKLVFNGKLLKLIYAIDVPSTASIWWKNYKGFDNVKLFPENELSLQQEINYIHKLCESSLDEPLLIITKSPFILQEFPDILVRFAKLDESSVTQFIAPEEKTLGMSVKSIINSVSDVGHHPNLESRLNSIHDHLKNEIDLTHYHMILEKLESDDLKQKYYTIWEFINTLNQVKCK